MFYSQHFQKIRREYKGYNYGDDSPSRPSTSKVPKVSKSTTSKSTPQKRGMAQKGLFEPTTYQDDDEEDMGHLAKRKRSLKPEAPEEQSAPIFKMEGSGGSGPNGRAVDLVNDEYVFPLRYKSSG